MYLDDCVCVLPDLTLLPLLGVGRKSWYIIIITFLYSLIRHQRKFSKVLVNLRWGYMLILMIFSILWLPFGGE